MEDDTCSAGIAVDDHEAKARSLQRQVNEAWNLAIRLSKVVAATGSAETVLYVEDLCEVLDVHQDYRPSTLIRRHGHGR